MGLLLFPPMSSSPRCQSVIASVDKVTDQESKTTVRRRQPHDTPDHVIEARRSLPHPPPPPPSWRPALAPACSTGNGKRVAEALGQKIFALHVDLPTHIATSFLQAIYTFGILQRLRIIPEVGGDPPSIAARVRQKSRRLRKAIVAMPRPTLSL